MWNRWHYKDQIPIISSTNCKIFQDIEIFLENTEKQFLLQFQTESKARHFEQKWHRWPYRKLNWNQFQHWRSKHEHYLDDANLLNIQLIFTSFCKHYFSRPTQNISSMIDDVWTQVLWRNNEKKTLHITNDIHSNNHG